MPATISPNLRSTLLFFIILSFWPFIHFKLYVLGTKSSSSLQNLYHISKQFAPSQSIIPLNWNIYVQLNSNTDSDFTSTPQTIHHFLRFYNPQIFVISLRSSKNFSLLEQNDDMEKPLISTVPRFSSCHTYNLYVFTSSPVIIPTNGTNIFEQVLSYPVICPAYNNWHIFIILTNTTRQTGSLSSIWEIPLELHIVYRHAFLLFTNIEYLPYPRDKFQFLRHQWVRIPAKINPSQIIQKYLSAQRNYGRALVPILTAYPSVYRYTWEHRESLVRRSKTQDPRMRICLTVLDYVNATTSRRSKPMSTGNRRDRGNRPKRNRTRRNRPRRNRTVTSGVQK